MKYLIASSALAATALAQAPPYFGVMSTRSASPLHFQQLTARGGKFFLGGGPPSSYCPPVVKDGCPPGNSTVLAGGYEGGLSLGVVVPGGQQVYVGPDGTLSYTQAHSAYIPIGSVVDGWSRTEGENFGNLAFKDGLYGCPAGEGNGYQVFGKIDGVELKSECLGFNALTFNSTQPGAWQY